MTNLNPTKLLIQVINLERRPDRLAQISAELTRAGLSFETQIAVDGQIDSYESEFISKGAIGCSKSHINAMRRIVESKAEFGLILEDDATLSTELNQLVLSKMIDLMDRNQLDILQIGFIDWLYPPRKLRSGILEFLIDFRKRNGIQDSSGFRFVLGEFRDTTHAYIINARFAKALLDTSPEQPLVPWDNYLSMLARGQMHQGIKIARLVKSFALQVSYQMKGQKADSDVTT
jgi:GR25 family glycosyltransferase involved in LPS biosynthesis